MLNSFGKVATHVATGDDPNHEVDYYYFYNGLGLVEKFALPAVCRRRDRKLDRALRFVLADLVLDVLGFGRAGRHQPQRFAELAQRRVELVLLQQHAGLIHAGFGQTRAGT